MTKATEDQLAILHNRVAETMTAALDQSDRAAALIVKYTLKEDTELPLDIMRFLEACKEVNPSLLTAATKFLKDNNISVDADEESATSALAQRLSEKKSGVKDIKYDA